MAGKQMFPASKDDRGNFRFGTNRRVDLTLRQELDDVAKKSMAEILSKKEQMKVAPLNNLQHTSKKLKPAFRPERIQLKRKNEPVFHKDMVNTAPKGPSFVLIPSVAPYNPLDKEPSTIVKEEKTKKFPYNKADTVKTTDMSKPHHTSLGIIPARDSSAVPGIKVYMEGHPAAVVTDKTLDEIAAANKCPPVTPVNDISTERAQQESSFDTDELKHKVAKKPAILSSEGTSQPVTMTARDKPVPHPPMIWKPPGRKKMKISVQSARSITSSLRSEEIILPGEAVFSQYDDAIAAIDLDVPTAVAATQEEDRDSQASSSSMKSVKELLDEAKRITSPDAEPLFKQHIKKKESPRKDKKVSMKDKKESKKLSKGEKSKGKGKDEDAGRPKSGRSVDEIIASLKNQSRIGMTTDADRRIQEIMERVMSRTSTVLSDVHASSTESPETQKENEQDQEAESLKLSTPHTPQQLPLEGAAVSPALTPAGDKHSRLSSPLAMSEGKREVDVPEIIPEGDMLVTDAEKGLMPTEDEQLKMPVLDRMEKPETPVPQPDIEGSVVVPRLELHRVFHMDSSRVEDEEEITSVVDIQKAYEDLMLPVDTTYEELVSIQGKQTDLKERQPPTSSTDLKPTVYSTSTSFLSSWQPKQQKVYEGTQEPVPQLEKSVHHFCTATDDYQLPKEFQNIGRKYHTPSRMGTAAPLNTFRFGDSGPATALGGTTSRMSVIAEVREEEDRRMSAAANRILEEAQDLGDKEDSLETWQLRAEKVFDQPNLSVGGAKINLKSDESRLYWTPAPPKLDVIPSRVRDVLFPEYTRASVAPETQIAQVSIVEESDSDDEIDEELYMKETETDRDRDTTVERLLYKKCLSHEDLTDLMKAVKQREEDIMAGKVVEPQTRRREIIESVAGSVDGSRESTPIGPPLWTGEMPDSMIFPVFPPPRRTCSEPNLVGDDETLIIPQDFNTAMDEIKRQRASVKKMKLADQLEEVEKIQETETESVVWQETYQSKEGSTYTAPKLPVRRKDEPTPAELALRAGRSYVILPKKKKKKGKSSISLARIQEVESFLESPPNRLIRSASSESIPKQVPREFRVPPRIRSRIRTSVPDLLNFDEYATKRHIPADANVREWTRDIWNVWFDQVFPPTPPESESEEQEEKISTEDSATPQQPEKGEKDTTVLERKPSPIPSSLPGDLEVIEPLAETEETLEELQILREEAEKLTKEIETSDVPKAFDLCRRGALYRKIGMVKKAEDDLNVAILMEPMLLDAYWHRHLLFLLQDRKQSALEDLKFILKHSKNHSGAHRSMAEIYRRQGDITMAIVNYTQAIKLNPRDHEAYFRRAEMYEKRGDMLLALEDYSVTTKIKPSRTDAILKHGLYYFEHESWANAISDFTDLLKVDPLNAMARLYRGRAYAKLGHWSPGVEDMSAAIHLNPQNWEALYHRACILRKAHPRRALQDYSMSLLINDTEENIMSYLHRGILYNSMKRPTDAIPDFESVLKLNKDVACAHVNLGLILLNHYQNYHRAIKKFTSAIKVDPTYVRAYVCRGEAYHKIHELKLALRDFSRAIHLRPDVQHYYMYRGQLVLEMGNLELAAFCVRHAAEMSTESSLGQMPTQQAVVQSFLKNYDKAIEALENATKQKPVASLYMLLGKTQMKAKHFSDSIVSFDRALQLYQPWRSRDPWPAEAAEAHYLIGKCHTELRSYLEALEAFSNAIRLDPNFAEALYQRGIARMKLKLSKGIQDFNRALAINPRIFQAYLSRACYYGLKKNYTKAILNCNEALKIQPNSVRAYLYRGALKYNIMAYELAIRDLTKAASIDRTCGLAYFNRAICYQESKEYTKALQDYGVVMLIGDQMILKVLINRGLLYFEQGDFTNALYDFKMAAKLNPEDHRILHTLGLCYHKMGHLKNAIEVFTTCINNKPFFLDGIIARGNVFMDFGNQEGIKYASRDYERAVMKDPSCMPARVNLAYTLQVSGKFMQAWIQFTRALTLRPTYKPALEGRAIVNLQMSDTFAAYQDIHASIRVSPTAELLTNRGVINQFMQDRVNAMRDYQEAISMDPTYSLAYFNAANVYFHTRHFRQALDYYNKAIENNTKDESAFLNRAITKVMLRDAEGALKDFKAAIKLSPYSAHMYFNRGNFYLSMQQYDKAEKDYSTALKLKPDDPFVLKRRADVRGKLEKREAAIEDYRLAIRIQSHLQGE